MTNVFAQLTYEYMRYVCMYMPLPLRVMWHISIPSGRSIPIRVCSRYASMGGSI